MRVNAGLGARFCGPVFVSGQSSILEPERDSGTRCSFEEFVDSPNTGFESVCSFEMRSNRSPCLTLLLHVVEQRTSHERPLLLTSQYSGYALESQFERQQMGTAV